MAAAEPAAIFFDAVGTLIHPTPSAVDVYLEVGQRFGSQLDRATISRRFRHFFQIEEEADRHANLATSEERERRRWRNIVAGVLDDVSDAEACFHALYDHFGRPAAWSCDPAAELVLTTLARKGHVLGLASNYDHRLRSVAVGLEPLRFMEHMIISSEVGFRKPATEFFAAIREAAALPAAEILYVGDDRANDFDGARRAGMRAWLVEGAGSLERLL